VGCASLQFVALLPGQTVKLTHAAAGTPAVQSAKQQPCSINMTECAVFVHYICFMQCY
jgi:hypothetical protein